MIDNTLYSDESIESLDPREHVRLRPGMYVGDTADSTQLLMELFGNALDEHNLKHGNTIEASVDTQEGIITVADEGQGFPVNVLREDGETVLQASFDVVNTSGKYSDDGVYGGVSVGLNGLGSKVCNFLSSWLKVRTIRDGHCESLEFTDGQLSSREIDDVEPKSLLEKSGTTVIYKPSPEFFASPLPNLDKVRQIFDDTCALCPDLFIEFNINDESAAIFHHPEGISYLLEKSSRGATQIVSSPLTLSVQEGDRKLTCGLTYSDSDAATIIPYVNYGLTDAGPHISTLKSCITKTLNSWGREKSLIKQKEKNLDGASLQEGLVLVFNLVTPGVSYDAQTKAHITSSDFTGFLASSFSEQLELWLDVHPEDGERIIKSALVARKAAAAAKKARAAVKAKSDKKDKVFKLPTKLTDCWSKDRSECELYLTEGLSAASGLVAARDSKTQAVYGLRGKGLNVLKTTPGRIVANQEINNIIQALGLDYNPRTGKMIYDKRKLRYGKIIAASDADFDGFMIRNLIYNILWYLCPEIITNGHVYAAEPPLFRVTTKRNQYLYMRDQKVLEDYKKKHQKEIKSIGRNKGLGEQDSEELEETLLNPATRNIVQLGVKDIDKTDELFDIMYGKKVEPRVKYLNEHLREADVD